MEKWLVYCTVDILVINGKSNSKVIENYLLLLGSVYYNYLLLEDFDYLLLITGYYFENRSITYYFSITYYLLPHVCTIYSDFNHKHVYIHHKAWYPYTRWWELYLMKKFNYVLEIDILRNSPQKIGVSWGVLFKGLGVQKDMAKTMINTLLVGRTRRSENW